MSRFDHLPRDLLARILSAFSSQQNFNIQRMQFSEKPYFLHGKFNPFTRKQDENLPASLQWALNRICNCYSSSNLISREGILSLAYNHVFLIVIIV